MCLFHICQTVRQGMTEWHRIAKQGLELLGILEFCLPISEIQQIGQGFNIL